MFQWKWVAAYTQVHLQYIPFFPFSSPPFPFLLFSFPFLSFFSFSSPFPFPFLFLFLSLLPSLSLFSSFPSFFFPFPLFPLPDFCSPSRFLVSGGGQSAPPAPPLATPLSIWRKKNNKTPFKKGCAWSSGIARKLIVYCLVSMLEKLRRKLKVWPVNLYYQLICPTEFWPLELFCLTSQGDIWAQLFTRPRTDDFFMFLNSYTMFNVLISSVVNLILSPHHIIVAFYIQSYWNLHSLYHL